MARLAVQREDRRLPDKSRSQGGLLRSQRGRWGRQDRPSVKGGLLEVGRDTRQLVLAAQVAAIYAAVLIPFKVGIPIIPGFVELRPANAIPVVASLLFGPAAEERGDRKSTRLNSSHITISYAVFCLKKKKKIRYIT